MQSKFPFSHHLKLKEKCVPQKCRRLFPRSITAKNFALSKIIIAPKEISALSLIEIYTAPKEISTTNFQVASLDPSFMPPRPWEGIGKERSQSQRTIHRNLEASTRSQVRYTWTFFEASPRSQISPGPWRPSSALRIFDPFENSFYIPFSLCVSFNTDFNTDVLTSSLLFLLFSSG